MGSSLGYLPGIAIAQFLVVYERGSEELDTWRGYYDSFDDLDSAKLRVQEALADGYKCAIFDVRNGTVISRHP